MFAALRAGVGNATTLNTYVTRLQQAARSAEAVPAAEVGDARALERGVLALLRSPLQYGPVLARLYGGRSTHKNVLTAVLAAYKHYDALRSSNPAALRQWKAAHATLCNEEEARYDENRPLNVRQVERYVSFDEVERTYARMASAPDAHATPRGSVELLLLALVVHLAPKRSDLGRVSVYRSAAAAERDAGPDDNFAVLPSSAGGKARLVLRRFKTSAKHPEIVEDFPPELARVARASLAAHPRRWLLVGARGEPYSNNAYTKFFMRTFRRLFGREAGPSLMRHAYVSERVDFDSMSRVERKDIARRMGHTIEVQERMYKWVEVPGQGRAAAQGRCNCSCKCK